MKDYDRYVIWLDYFNSELKRSEGRRVPISVATKSPTLEQLEGACRKLSLDPVAQRGQFPSSAPKESGYVSIRKEKPKKALILKIAKELSTAHSQAPKK
ncbi:MAG TPA: signal recognition particle subunit SRP19/SEC65 family protein [Nitrososphaerales archaeon]|nr:signal recognition particle subunit SRP19/SEC65 family protein [Nitrososphaerales archaeon]